MSSGALDCPVFASAENQSCRSLKQEEPNMNKWIDDWTHITNRDAILSGPNMDSKDYDVPGSAVGNRTFRKNQWAMKKDLRPWLYGLFGKMKAVAITITFAHPARQNISSELRRQKFQGYRRDPVWSSYREEIKKFLSSLHKKLSYWAFKKAAKRHKKRLGFLAVTEGADGGNLHVHCMMELPPGERGNLLEYELSETLNRHPHVGEFKIKPINDNKGWISYMIKGRGKSDISQDVLMELIYPPSHKPGKTRRNPLKPTPPSLSASPVPPKAGSQVPFSYGKRKRKGGESRPGPRDVSLYF